MSRTNPVERERALFNLAQHGVPYEDAVKIRRYAAAYNTIQERWCNEEMSVATWDKVKAQEARLMVRIQRLMFKHGLDVVFAGDPRGRTVIGVATSDAHGVEEWMIA